MLLTRRTFLQQLGLGTTGIALISALPESALAHPFKTVQLPRSLPEAQGVASSGILNFINAVEAGKLNVHSLMVLRRGQVLAEGWWAPYAPNLKHTLYSLSKSFASTAIGLAVAEGRLTVNDKVVSLFPDKVPATISPNLAAMRVKDLLTMSTGHDKDSTPALRSGDSNDWVKAFLAQPVEHEPGTFFVYNSGATYMLSAIIQKLTGQTLLDYLKPRLFAPLGIEGADWEVNEQGVNTGGWGLRVRTEDIAKFGQLYLQKGMWNGKRILPESWVADATRSHIMSKGGARPAEKNDWLQGYGYQFWRCRNGAYRGDGANGQYCIVLPEQEMVVAITSETGDMQAIMDQVWDHILPAVQADKLPANASAQGQLKQKLTSLALPMLAGQTTSPLVGRVSGKPFEMAENPMKIKTVSLQFRPEACVVTLRDDKGEHRINCGLNRWTEGRTDLSTLPIKLVPTPVPGEKETRLAASGVWTDDNTFTMQWRFIETAHYDLVTCRFTEAGLQMEFRKSLSVLNPANKDPRPVLEGKLLAAVSEKR
ncbi:serine hydrolase domain-containing protein [Tellurirhabdus rosea]|uniref:serine hydrolase domain-containing protein n=1 Tax=Tellurirhabdus rosea TaxID=2674997 RepID=UPI00225A27B9|nr:serine hydrolase [Tellurirhabdus rosea]